MFLQYGVVKIGEPLVILKSKREKSLTMIAAIDRKCFLGFKLVRGGVNKSLWDFFDWFIN